MIAAQSKSPEQQAEVLQRGIDTFLPKDELAARIAEGRPLRVKLGLDPTAPSVTLGWAVVLRKLRQFQDLGHTAVLIVGDFTTQVGDPSGQSETRKPLTAEEVDRHARSVLKHFGRILSPDNLEIRRNSEWLRPLDMGDVLKLTATTTLAQMLERDDFAKRLAARRPISMMEFIYPLLQGYDSVAVEADLELGGSDQLFNLVMGRQIQQRYGQRPQMILTMPLLIGTDGRKKMSQSLGNYIGVDDPPNEMFGKTMSVPDAIMPQWLRLASGLEWEEMGKVIDDLEMDRVHPGEAKRGLARSIVDLYHGSGAGADAEAAFDRQFKLHRAPDDMPAHALGSNDPVYVPGLLAAAGLVASNSEGRRMLAQGAVRVDGSKVTADTLARGGLGGAVLSVGKRRFVRLVDR